MVGFIVTDANGHTIAAHSAGEEKKVQTNNSTFKSKNGANENLPTMEQFTVALRTLVPDGPIVANHIRPAKVLLPFGTLVHDFLRKCPALERDVTASTVTYIWKPVMPEPSVSDAVPETTPPQTRRFIQEKIEFGHKRMVALYHATSGEGFCPSRLSKDQIRDSEYNRATLQNSLHRFAKLGKYVRRVEDASPIAYEWREEFATEVGPVQKSTAAKPESADSIVKLEGRIARDAKKIHVISARIQALVKQHAELEARTRADKQMLVERKSEEAVRTMRDLPKEVREQVLATFRQDA